MSFMTKTLAAAATMTLVGGAVAYASGTAHAATPSCGSACVDVFSDQFSGGIDTGHPGFLMDSFKQGIATGTSVILFQESNHDPALDFVFENQGTVADFFAAGLVGATTALHYGCIAGTSAFPTCIFAKDQSHDADADDNANLDAFEVEYAPFGAATGQCVGVAATPTSGEHVTLQPCGVSSKTVWIVDAFDGGSSPEGFGDDGAFGHHPNDSAVPLINGANTNFSHPFVLTYPSNSFPTDHPRPVLFVSNLTGFFTGIFPSVTTANADVSSNQLWDALTGTVTG